jgi:hypothetical protein
MDIATFGIVIDPRQAKAGAAETKAELKSIEVTAKETQSGVVAAFEDTATKRKITIRDSAAAMKQSEGEITATVQAEAQRRNQVDAATAAAARERTQERLAASQRALEQMAAAEIDSARRASAAAIDAAAATKESSLAAIEAVRAGRLAEAREAVEAAQGSATAMKESLNAQAAAERDLTAQQKALLRERTGDSKAAAKDAMEAQKTAIAEVEAAEKAMTAAAKQTAKERAEAARLAAKATRDGEKAAAEAENGWRKLERGSVQALATMGLIAPGANTALVAVQSLTTGIELLGAGVAIATGLIVALIAAGAGIAAITGLFMALKAAADLEPLRNELANVQGSYKGIEDRLREIQEIQRDAGGLFKLPDLVNASRDLTLFSEGALKGRDALHMVADAAVAVGKPVDQVAAAVGKLYGAIQAGAPIDRYAKALINLRVINEDVLVRLDNAQKGGEKPAEIWAKAEAALKGYSGAMDQYGHTVDGTLGRIRVDISHTLEEFGKPLLPLIEPALRSLERQIKALVPAAEEAGQLVAGAIIMADWDTVSRYIGLQFKLGLNTAWKETVDYLKGLLLGLPAMFMAKMKEQFTTPGGIMNLYLPGLGTAYNMTQGIARGVDSAGSDNAQIQKQINAISEAWRNAAANSLAKETSLSNMPSAPAGTGEVLDRSRQSTKVRDDATVMADFIEQLKELTYKMQSEGMSPTEFQRRRGALQDSTVKELGDPGKANDIYSDPAAADKAWQDILGKWRVFQEERARLAEQADEKIKAGTASVNESMMRGLDKVSEQWGNLQQHISAGVGAIAQSVDTNLTGAITALVTGTKDAKTAFRDMTIAILNDIVKTCVQLLVELAIRQRVRDPKGRRELLRHALPRFGARPKGQGARLRGRRTRARACDRGRPRGWHWRPLRREYQRGRQRQPHRQDHHQLAERGRNRAPEAARQTD